MNSTGERPADRLADWLEGLDLAQHLAAAGLPTFVRDDQGRAVWTDPATDLEMTAEQLEALDVVLHSTGDDPEHAVPLALVQVAREARLRAALLDTAWFDYAALAELRGTSVDAARFMIHKTASLHRLLVIGDHRDVIVPAFQLTDEGEPRPDLEPVLQPLLAAGMDPWKAWIWLTQPAALLGGLVPERAAADPEDAEIVARAAVRLAERVASA